MRRGYTLIELLVVLSITVLVGGAATGAYVAGIEFQSRVEPERERILARTRFEDGLTTMLQSAYLSPEADDTRTFFVTQADGAASTLAGYEEGPAADSLSWTTLGLPPQTGVLLSFDDFETRNSIYGPQGGVVEWEVSARAVGGTGEQTGPFLREQRPSDGDPSQGGDEQTLWPDLSTIAFEFYDGAGWVGEWDSAMNRQLPSAVRVTYATTDLPDENRVFVVRLPHSPIDPSNPDPAATGATP